VIVIIYRMFENGATNKKKFLYYFFESSIIKVSQDLIYFGCSSVVDIFIPKCKVVEFTVIICVICQNVNF